MKQLNGHTLVIIREEKKYVCIYYGDKYDYKIGITGSNAVYAGFMYLDTINDDGRRIDRIYLNDFNECIKEIANTEEVEYAYLLKLIRLNEE